MAEFGFEMIDLQNIGQKFYQLVYFFSDAYCRIGRNSRTPSRIGCAPGVPVGVVPPMPARQLHLSRTVQMVLDMQDTAARRAYDIIELLEILYKEVIGAFGKMLETRICHRLTTAGLAGGIDHLASIFFQ